jgi:hypothetical protein
MITRRLFAGLAALIVAPAIVRAKNIMPVKWIRPELKAFEITGMVHWSPEFTSLYKAEDQVFSTFSDGQWSLDGTLRVEPAVVILRDGTPWSRRHRPVPRYIPWDRVEEWKNSDV